MKANTWLGIISLGVLLIGGTNVYIALDQHSNDMMPYKAGHSVTNKEYIKAKNAIEIVHKNLEVKEVYREKGVILVSVWNPSKYTFNSLMIDVEFINSDGEAYYYETIFLTDGLRPNELNIMNCVVTDKEKLNDAVSFNFFIQGF